MGASVVAMSPSPELVDAVRRIGERVEHERDHEAIPESMWTALTDPTRDPHIAVDADGRAAAIVARSDSFQASHQQLAVAASADAPAATIDAVVAAALQCRRPSDALVAWIPGADPRIVEALVDGGFRVDREQYQMRVTLPVAGEVTLPAGIRVLAFRRGRDEDAWLRVNNRAFSNHPDQGGWIRRQLERRMAAPWFDPAGFLLAWRDDELLGSCWTKVHDQPERLGEIFVIGIVPSAQGLGLGRALVLAGLAYLSEVRACPTGVLYVAAANTGAVALYESLGFRIRRTDTALTIPAQTAG